MKSALVPDPLAELALLPPLLSAEHICTVLGRSRSTLDSYRKQPGFPAAIKINGRSLRWPKAGFIAWLKSLPSDREGVRSAS